MTRLIMLGDAGHTGFGTVTRDLGGRFIANGMDVRFISQNVNSEPLPEPFASRTWNAMHQTFDFVGALTSGFPDGWKADALLMLGDFEATRSLLGAHPQIREAVRNLASVHYVPIEGIDLPPTWKNVWEIVRPVAMTEFGANEIAKVTGTRPPVVFHGVNTDDFYPVSFANPGTNHLGKAIMTKDAAKRLIGFPTERLLVLRTDRHMPRKDQNRLIRAMVPVFEAVPDLDLVLHCRWLDEGGFIADTVMKLPTEFQNRVKSTGRSHNTYTGLSREDLNCLYNAADIYVQNSAEGFGLTPAEALACGVPVVGIDYSAVPEVVGPGGICVPYSHLIDNQYDHFWAAVDEAAFAEAVIRLARKPSLRRKLGAAGAAHVRKMFNWDVEARKMMAIIDDMVAARAVAA